MNSADSVRRIPQSSITHCKMESCKSRQLKFYLFSAHDIQHLERQREDDEREAGPEGRTEDAVLMEDEDGEEDAVDRLEIEGEAVNGVMVRWARFRRRHMQTVLPRASSNRYTVSAAVGMKSAEGTTRW